MKLTREVCLEVLRLYEEGYRNKEIMAITGVTSAQASNIKAGRIGKTVLQASLNERAKDRIKKYTEVDSSGCWVWQSTVINGGYGQVRFDGKRYVSHKLSYLVFKGDVPEGKMVCHTCDNRLCVNPDHLWLGSHKDNMKDMIGKGRQAKGEAHASSKLTDDTVRRIRKDYDTGMYSQEGLGSKYGVDQTTISRVVLRHIWKHL